MARYTNELHERRWNSLLPPDELKALLAEAHEKLGELCRHTAEWTMHIPPEQDDPDILFGDALQQTELLLERLEAAERCITEARELNDGLVILLYKRIAELEGAKGDSL